MFFPRLQIDRKKGFKRLAYSLIFVVVFFWLGYFLGEPSTTNWKGITLDSSFVIVAIALSAVYLALSVFLYRGQEWAWLAAMFFVEMPVFALVLIGLPSPSGCFVVFGLMEAFSTLIATAPRLSDYLPSKVDSNLDETAHSLGLVWQDQPLWKMVQLAKKGEAGKAANQYRSQQHATWDQAEQAIKLFMLSELELKTHLLKEHVQSFTASSGPPLIL